MEKTTLINGNGRPYEREIPKVVIQTFVNPVALDWLRQQTGIDFKKTVHDTIEGQPETWEQFSKIFLTYNFLTMDQNNWDGNIMHLRGACHIPFGKKLTYEQDGKTFLGVDGWC